MSTLIEKIEQSILKKEQTFEGSIQLKEFEESNQEFEELIEKGLIKKRGNNLLSSAEAHMVSKVFFNAT